MVAIAEPPLEHIVLPHISWNTFERDLDEIGKARFRIGYLDGNLEMMKVNLEHNNGCQMIGRLIFFAAFELYTPLRSGGSTTLKEPRRQVGIEHDRYFWIRHEKHMRGKKAWNALKNPPPDLVVEIEITTSWLDRPDIYAALKVPEVWRWGGKTLEVLVLGNNGKYKERAKSLAFPSLPMDGIAGFAKKIGSVGEVALVSEFKEWLRAEAATTINSTGKRNAKRR